LESPQAHCSLSQSTSLPTLGEAYCQPASPVIELLRCSLALVTEAALSPSHLLRVPAGVSGPPTVPLSCCSCPLFQSFDDLQQMVSALTGSWQSLWLIHHRFVLLPLNLYASWVLHVHLALQLPCIALYASHDTGYKGSIRSRIPWYRRLNGYGFDPGSHGILQFFGP